MAKQRLSFVTNSSSSSFILAVKDQGFLKSGSSALETLVKKIIFGNAEIVKNKKEFDEYFFQNHVWGAGDLQEFLQENEEENSEYEKWLKYIEDGYLIIDRTIDSGDETMLDLINELPDNENIIIISLFIRSDY